MAHSLRFRSERLRPSDSPTPSLAGPHCPAPLRWLARHARFFPRAILPGGGAVTPPAADGSLATLSLREAFAPRTPLPRPSRGPLAPLRSGASLAPLASPPVLSSLEAARSPLLPPMAHSLRFRSERLRPSDSPTPSLAGPHCPAPLRWLARHARFFPRA